MNNAESNPLQVKRFDHITLVVADLEKSRHFYVEVLGMREVERPDFDFPGAWFQVGSIQIHATVSDPKSGLAGWGSRQAQSISRGHHFAFQVASVERAVAEIKSRGIKIAAGPKFRPDGIRQLYIYDPDEHLVELFSSAS